MSNVRIACCGAFAAFALTQLVPGASATGFLAMAVGATFAVALFGK